MTKIQTIKRVHVVARCTSYRPETRFDRTFREHPGDTPETHARLALYDIVEGNRPALPCSEPTDFDCVVTMSDGSTADVAMTYKPATCVVRGEPAGNDEALAARRAGEVK